MALRRTSSSHHLREKVVAYQIIDHDFQLVRRWVVGSKLRKRYRDPHKSNCLEHHLEQIIGRWRLCRNLYAPRMLHESEAPRSHRSHAPIFALGRKYGSDTCIRCGPAPEACNPLQLNGIDMESAALETPADTRHSPQTSQQTYLLMSQPLSYYDDSYRNPDARRRFSSLK